MSLSLKRQCCLATDISEHRGTEVFPGSSKSAVRVFPPSTTRKRIYSTLKIGYFAQNQATLLDGETTVFKTIDDVAVGDIRTKIRDILGAFMFGRDDIDKYVKVPLFFSNWLSSLHCVIGRGYMSALCLACSMCFLVKS